MKLADKFDNSLAHCGVIHDWFSPSSCIFSKLLIRQPADWFGKRHDFISLTGPVWSVVVECLCMRLASWLSVPLWDCSYKSRVKNSAPFLRCNLTHSWWHELQLKNQQHIQARQWLKHGKTRIQWMVIWFHVVSQTKGRKKKLMWR